MTRSDLDQLVVAIATTLGETRRAPQVQIARIVRVLGVERATALVMQAMEIERRGGLLLPDGSRRRTPGGVFFFLAKQTRVPGVHRRRRRSTARRTPPLAPPLATWTSRRTLIQPALNEKGVVTDVKITLVGRPGALVRRQHCLIMAMEPARGPSLPRGLPPIPPSPTTYTVYVAQKDWAAVDAVLADATALLVVDGWAAYDPELEGIAVFVMQATVRQSPAQAAASGDASPARDHDAGVP